MWLVQRKLRKIWNLPQILCDSLGCFGFFNLTLAVKGNNFGIPSISDISLELPVRGRKYCCISYLAIVMEKALLCYSGSVVNVL